MLESITGPRDLKAMSEDELKALADELRSEIIATVARTGGHLASNLGTVELTIARLYSSLLPIIAAAYAFTAYIPTFDRYSIYLCFMQKQGRSVNGPAWVYAYFLFCALRRNAGTSELYPRRLSLSRR